MSINVMKVKKKHSKMKHLIQNPNNKNYLQFDTHGDEKLQHFLIMLSI